MVIFWTRTGSDTFGLTLLKAEAASPSSSHSKCELLHLQGGLCWNSAAACQKSHLCTSKMIAYCYSWSLPSCTFRRLYWSLCCWIWDTCCVTVAWSCSFWDVKVLIRCFSSSSSWSCERKKSTILYINIVILLTHKYNPVRKVKESSKTWAPPLGATWDRWAGKPPANLDSYA